MHLDCQLNALAMEKKRRRCSSNKKALAVRSCKVVHETFSCICGKTQQLSNVLIYDERILKDRDEKECPNSIRKFGTWESSKKHIKSYSDF